MYSTIIVFNYIHPNRMFDSFIRSLSQVRAIFITLWIILIKREVLYLNSIKKVEQNLGMSFTC